MSDNIQAFQYGIKVRDSLDYLARPMLKKFGATGLAYCKIFDNGRRLYLHTNNDWIKMYCDNKFENDLSHLNRYVPQKDMKYSVESFFKKDKITEASLFMSCYHEFNTYREGGGYFEYFGLFTNSENHQFPNLCLNNLKVLDACIDDFQKNAVFLLSHTDKKRLIKPKNWNFSSLKDIFSDSTPLPDTKSFLERIKT